MMPTSSALRVECVCIKCRFCLCQTSFLPKKRSEFFMNLADIVEQTRSLDLFNLSS